MDRKPDRFSHRSRQWLSWVLVILTIGVVFFNLEQLNNLADQGRFVKYTYYATEILEGRCPVDRLPDLSPGYLWTMVGLFKVAGPSFETLQVFQVSLLGLVSLLVFWTARHWAGDLAGIAAWLALTASRAPLVNASETEPETLLLFFMSLSLWTMLAGFSDQPWRNWKSLALTGFLIGAATITRPTAALVFLLWLGWLLKQRGSSTSPTVRLRKLKRFAGPLAFCAGFVVLPVAVVLFHLFAVGTATIMNPGTVAYEGMNPRTTGFGGEAPAVVKEIEKELQAPDALHLAYRRVTTIDLQTHADAESTNRYWTGRAVRYATSFPKTSISLLLRKGAATLSSHEIFDLGSLVKRDLELKRIRLWLPFGVLLVIAIVASSTKKQPAIWPLVFQATSPLLVTVLFYVSSRQRNAAMPALTVLAGIGVAYLIQEWLAGRRRRVVLLSVLIGFGAVVLGLDTHPLKEDRYRWRAAFSAKEALVAADSALSRGEDKIADAWLAEAATWLSPLPVRANAQMVQSHIRNALRQDLSNQRRFDLAIAAMRIQDWELADRFLAQLAAESYRPVRGSICPPSISYHRARCQLRLDNRQAALPLIRKALVEAPGDAETIELALAFARSAVTEQLPESGIPDANAFNDGLTVMLARARALADVGWDPEAIRILDDLQYRAPELGQSIENLRTELLLRRSEGKTQHVPVNDG